MKAPVLLLVSCLPLGAHVMSMSTGDLMVAGSGAHYELSMPIYEIAHIANPEVSLFEHIRFSVSGAPGRMVRKSCHAEIAQGAYLCSADYEFGEPVDRLEAECTFYQITVPNHVHLLRAVREGKNDQAIFDFSFTKADIRFRPPTAAEVFFTQAGAGFVRALGGLAQILFLAALALAARGRRELAALAGMFLLGQIVAATVASTTRWEPAARFVEAATALTIAYMAVEILALPQAGKRWLIAGALGVFHGLYFALFLRNSEFSAFYVLAGAAVAEMLLLAIFALVFGRVARLGRSFRPVQVSASLLLGIGMYWFFIRLKS